MHKQGGKYSHAYIRALLARVRIEEVIGDFVKLRRVNERYAYTRCPIHDEKTASFTVSEEGGFYHCFGCGSRGDAAWFLVQYFALHSRHRRTERELRKRGRNWWQVIQITERYARRFLTDEKVFEYLDAIRYLAKKYRYWPSQHRRLEKRLKKM